MSDTGYRIATRVPWDADHGPDWGRIYDTEKSAIDEVLRRAKLHKGAKFRLRERKETFGPERRFNELDTVIANRIDDSFHVGDTLVLWSLSDNVQWLIRKVHTRPEVMDVSDGNDGIDVNHTLIFGKDGRKKHPNAESWGILNKRYISGTTTWSQHAPWHEDQCTSNAEDFHAPTLDGMRSIADDIVRNGKAAKMLLAGEEWLPASGWRFVGSYIDHYDHLHCEPFPTRTGIC